MTSFWTGLSRSRVTVSSIMPGRSGRILRVMLAASELLVLRLAMETKVPENRIWSIFIGMPARGRMDAVRSTELLVATLPIERRDGCAANAGSTVPLLKFQGEKSIMGISVQIKRW